MQRNRSEHLFIVRLWQEANGERGSWRGFVEHVGTRQRRYFSDLDALTAYVAAHIAHPVASSDASAAHDGQTGV